MCRQGGYYDQAVYLAKKNKEHELVIDILIEDSKSYEEALDYIWRLGPELAYPNLMKYARVLLEHCPQDTTQVFIDYYTGEYRPKKDTPLPSIQVSQGYGAVNAVSNLTSFIPLPYRQTSINPSPATAGNQDLALQGADAAGADAAEPPSEYDIPKPRTAFSSFVDHPDNFITFLEACLKQENIEKSDRADLYTTLFEMYLETANNRKGEEKEVWEAKAKRLIDDKDVMIVSYHLHHGTDSYRYPSTPRTFCCFPISQISETGPYSSGSNKVFVSTYSDRIPPQTTPLEPSKP